MRSRFVLVLLFLILPSLGFKKPESPYQSPDLRSQNPETVPAEIEGVGLRPQLGAQLDLNLEFTNEAGQNLKLKDIFDGTKPVFLSVVYFTCPNLCSLHLDGVVRSFNQMERWETGKDFKFVALSMHHKEDLKSARAFKEKYRKMYMKDSSSWSFLMGHEKNIRAVTDKIGFDFKWLEGRQEYSHAAAGFVFSPEGKLARVLPGVEFDPKTLSLALVEAGRGEVGSWVDRALLFCFQFDHSKNKYVLYAHNIMRIAAGLVALLLLLVLVPLWLKEKQRSKLQGVN